MLASHRIRPAMLAGLIAIVAQMTACAGQPEPTQTIAMAPLHTMHADVQAAPVAVREAYQFAVANPEVLAELPCYCGCGPIGHKNNYDCYVAGIDPAGVVQFDAHALGCSICVDITQDAMRMLRDGRTLKSIRQHVDVTYSRYGPTNIP